MKRHRRGDVAALLAVGALAACTEVSTTPEVPVSLQFDSLPALAVVVGDTMRGDSLVPQRVPVRGFDGGGGLVSDSLLRVIGIDTASLSAYRLAPGFRIIGLREAATVRIVAQAGGLQSQTQTFAVVPAPTGIQKSDTLQDSIFYNRADTTKRNVDIGVTLFRKVPDSTATPINGLRVAFRVDSFSRNLLDSVRLEGTSGGRRATGAYMTSGAAKVKVVVFPKKDASGSGAILLRASHVVKGVPLPNTPFPLTVKLVPSPGVSGDVRRPTDPLAPARALP